MPLPAGTKLGTYEVVAPIGAGGMGEVYQARDSNLRRDVAIKVLPDGFAHDPERLSRFRREAQLLAALNHSNIATIFGLEDSKGTSYLVMELVPGETLAERIKRDGAVPVEESLTIAKQIAEALEHAHEKGIIHRDLKPANVKLTPEGKVKVLDFGLAKAFAGDTSTDDMGNSPTLSMAATMQGVILGTAAYMSPEQAKGKAVDKRTDIWAFGCVLYELLTGKQAFHGEDITEILAAVVLKEPAFDALPANISPSIRVLLQRCLRKDKRQRTPDAATIRIEIEDAIAAPKDSGAAQAAQASASKLPWAVAAASDDYRGRSWRGRCGGQRGLLNSRCVLWCGWTLISDPTCRSAPRLEPTRSSLPTARGWWTCRKVGSIPGGWISPTPLSLQERKGHVNLSSPRTGSGSLFSLRQT